MAKRLLIGLFLFLLIGGGGLAIWSVQQKHLARVTPIAAPVQDSSKLVGQNVSFTVSEKGQKKWDLVAETARYTNDNTDATLEGVTGLVYSETGKPIARFKAPNGVFKAKQNGLTLTHGVKAQNVTSGLATLKPDVPQHEAAPGDAMTLEADTMAWSGSTPLVQASGHVRLTRPNQGISTADRCKFTMDFNRVNLEGHAQSNWAL